MRLLLNDRIVEREDINKGPMRPIPISMKQCRFILLLFLLFLLCAVRMQAQTFTIPDEIFRNCLKETYPHIFNSNDEVIIAEARTITQIDCSRKNVKSIEGIAYFENLESRWGAQNHISTIPEINGRV